MSTTREIDIIYQPDPDKKKVLVFKTPTIQINTNTITIGSNGFISNINSGDNVSITGSVYAVDPYSGTNEEVSLDDDTFSYSISFIIIPYSGLPNNLILTDNGNGTFSINGNIGTLFDEKYEFIVRAILTVTDTSSQTLVRTDDTDYYMYFTSSITDTNFFWDTNWLSSLPSSQITENNETYTVYTLSSLPKGINTSIGLSLMNQSDININYSSVSTNITGMESQSSVLPNNLRLYKIDNSNLKLGGNIDLTIDTSSGNVSYYFKIEVDDGNGNYGSPDTRNTIFEIIVLNYFSTEDEVSNMVVWNTSSGNIGTSYERYPSHFNISAYNPNGNSVTYQLSPNSNQLPNGMYIDSSTGMIMGFLPSVTIETDIKFIARASCGTQYSDRSFYITVLPLYGYGSYFDINIPYTFFNRILSTLFSWNTSAIPDDKVFRLGDDNFGRIVNPNIYFISGLQNSPESTGYWKTSDNTGTPVSRETVENITDQSTMDQYSSCFIDKLRNYHRPYDVSINGISYSPCYDPNGNYIYDVVYLTLTDNDSGDYRYFDSSNTEQYNYVNYDYQDTSNKRRFFSPSVRNCRLDLIQTENRLNDSTNFLRPNNTPGIGLLQNEGMPLWMLTTNPNTNTSLGYIFCIPLIYVVPGYGKFAIIQYEENNISQVYGLTFTINGYLVNLYNDNRIHFDLNTQNNVETTFDVSSGSGTWFDVSITNETVHVLFPEQENNI